MAPEVYESRNYSQASDIYALGMVLYCLLNQGNLPFPESGSSAAVSQLSGHVSASQGIVEQAFQRQPALHHQPVNTQKQHSESTALLLFIGYFRK